MRKKVCFFACAAVIAVACILLFYVRSENSYKLEYRDIVSAASAEFEVPEELIFALIKCESGFNADAVSSAGAVGLMQLMPDTFSEIAWRLKESPEPEMISDPKYSIRYGTFYIAYLTKYFGNGQTALAAYNAGMGNVKKWLADSRYSDDGIALKEIPFSETKKYVNNVAKAEKKYKEILGGLNSNDR